jgi:hypothetical protein
MASSAEITVHMDIPNEAALRLVEALAEEVVNLYKCLDEVGALLDMPPFPRNEELATRVEEFRDAIKITT